jgi:hypothetical protein
MWSRKHSRLSCLHFDVCGTIKFANLFKGAAICASTKKQVLISCLVKCIHFHDFVYNCNYFTFVNL